MKALLPKQNIKPVVPPIKCQGIKTQLVPFILENICWQGQGRWIEPFVGSGVVLFSLQPQRAVINDINPHIIAFYRGVFEGAITPGKVKNHLTQEGKLLLEKGETHYYIVRERFNQEHSPLDFLFLSRACFNGLMRFNQKGGFNVPFCHKPDRFRLAYITKIVNQVTDIRNVMKGKEWEFSTNDWRICLEEVEEQDFVYLDPPYIGRHTDYYNTWSEQDSADLHQITQSLPCGYALSMWKANKYRTNEYLHNWQNVEERTITHFYHVGSTEDLRHPIEEALLIKHDYATPKITHHKTPAIQPSLAF